MTARPRRARSRALVGIGVVAVIGAGLGAYLGIHGVEGAGSAPTGGQPPARSDAAMAYDAADGAVVLFGGQGRSGSLGDTWTWNGSVWTQAHPATSPPPLSGAQMTYDPLSHDILLVGGERLTGGPLGGVTVCESTGSAGSGSSGSSSSGSATWIPPSAAQPADVPAAGGSLSIPLISTGCGFSDAANAATWLWNGGNWTRAAGTTPIVAYGEWNLATDPVSGKALLLSDQSLVAEPDGPLAAPAIACPMQTTDTNGATKPSPCPVYPFKPRSQSWMWNGRTWESIKGAESDTTIMFGSRVVTDAVSGHLAIFGNEFLPVPSVTCPTCETGAPIPSDAPACCTGSISFWNGTTWQQAKGYAKGPQLSSGTLAGDPATRSDVALTTNGQTWNWTGVWTRLHPSTTPTALDGSASAYDATTGQVVVFGGIGLTGTATGLYDQTWTWDGSDWSLRGGSTSPAVTIPVPSPVSVPPSLPCPTLEPAMPPKAPQPQFACAGSTPGSTGGGSGSASGASGSVSSSGVLAP